MLLREKTSTFKKLVAVFASLAVAIGLTALLATLPQAGLVLSVTSFQEDLNFEYDLIDLENQITSATWQQEITAERTFPVKTLDIYQEGVARGQIIITNNRSTEQTLVASTRFLAEDQTLFTLANRVVIPAHNQIQADVTADLPGPHGDLVKGQRLTIPGLSEGLQKIVLAEAAEDFIGGVYQIGTISDADVAAARDELTAELRRKIEVDYLAQLLEQAATASPDTPIDTPELQTYYSILSETIEPNIGAQAGEFQYALKLRVTGLAYQQQELEQLIRRSAMRELKQGDQLAELSQPQVKLSEVTSDDDTLKQVLGVFVQAKTEIAEPSAALQHFKIKGLNEAELKAYFAKTPGVKLLDFKLSPFWVKRVPKHDAQINIQIN